MARTSRIRTAANDRAVEAASGFLFDEFALDRVFSALARMPDPDVTLKQAGITRDKLRVLEGDDEISGALETRRDALLATPWRLDRFESEPEKWIWAEVEAHLLDIRRGAWEAVPYGYSLLEAIYEPRTDGRIGCARIGVKPLEWFAPQPDGSVLWVGTGGAANDAAAQNQPLDPRKFFLTRRNPSYRQPYGEALLSRLYWPWFFRHNVWRFLMQYLERFGTPLILGQVSRPKDFVDAVTKLGIETVIGVGSEDKVSAVTQAAAGEFERTDAALSRRIQKTVLGQTLTTDVQGGGSYAAAKVHNQIRDDKRMSDIRLTTPTVQHFVNVLWALNQFPGPAPTVIQADDRGLELERAKRDGDLARAGVRFTPAYIERAYDFEPGEITVGAPPAEGQNPPPPAGDAGAGRPRLAAADEPEPAFTAAQREVERLADAALADAGDPIPTDLIRRAVRAASSPDDLRERLGLLLAGQPRTVHDAALARGLIAAEVLGYVHAGEEASAPAAPAEAAVDPLREREIALQERALRLLEGGQP